MFSDDQLKFQNISKNKEMFDILDVNEIDGCYYGLFLDEQRSLDFGRESYRIFKITTNGVVERLPYDILVPSMFKTSDSLYSLYVVVRQQDGTKVVDGEEVPNYTVNL